MFHSAILAILLIPALLLGAQGQDEIPRRFQQRPTAQQGRPGRPVRPLPIATPEETSTTSTTTTTAPIHAGSQSKAGIYLPFINGYRALHRAPPLKLDLELEEAAQHCADLHSLQGSAATPCPSSLEASEASGSSKLRTPVQALVYMLNYGWYAEQVRQVKWNGIDQPKYDEATKDVTQMLWKDTTSVGCGVSGQPDAKGEYYVTCFYRPQGNVQTGGSNAEYVKNVLLPL